MTRSRIGNQVTALTMAALFLLALPACTKTVTEVQDGDIDWGEPAEWERDQDLEPEAPEQADNTPLAREAQADTSFTQWAPERFRGSRISPPLAKVQSFSAWRAEGQDKGGLYIGTPTDLYYWDAASQAIQVAKKPSGLGEFKQITDMAYDSASDTRTIFLLAQTNLSNRPLYSIPYKDSLQVENGCQIPASGVALTFMHNILYIGTDAGVYSYTNGGLCSKSGDYPSDPVIDLSGDPSGEHMALLTSRSDPQKGLLYELHLYHGTTHTVYASSDDPQKGLLRARPTSLGRFKSENPARDEIWIAYAPDINGNPGGLQKLDAGGVFTTYKAQEGGLPSATITQLTVDAASGKIWLATPQGAVLFDPSSGQTPKVTVFNGQRYLLDVDVTTVGFDNEGGVWLGPDARLEPPLHPLPDLTRQGRFDRGYARPKQPLPAGRQQRTALFEHLPPQQRQPR